MTIVADLPTSGRSPVLQKTAMNPLPKAWEKYIFVTSNSFYFVSVLASCLLLMPEFCKET